jgi:hypothetical protein
MARSWICLAAVTASVGVDHYDDSGTKMILTPRWHTVVKVAELLNYGESKVCMLIITAQLGSIKDGRSRRILPEWVEARVQDRVKSTEDIW